jgi:hypothetical protein
MFILSQLKTNDVQNKKGNLNDTRVFIKRKFSPRKKEALYLMLLSILVAALVIWVSLYHTSEMLGVVITFEAIILTVVLVSFRYYFQLNKNEHEAIFLLNKTGGGDNFWSDKRVIKLLDL